MPGIGVVPYGIHMCQFYSSRDDLLAGLVPYVLTGLASDEQCLWIASPALPISRIDEETARYPDLSRGRASGQLVIIDAPEWYGDPAMLDAEKIIARCLKEEDRALAEGLQGLRFASTVDYIPRAHWYRLMDYEQKLHERIRNRRIVACGSYDRTSCRPVDILEVVHRHDGAIDRSGEHWEVFFHPPHYNGEPKRDLLAASAAPSRKSSVARQ